MENRKFNQWRLVTRLGISIGLSLLSNPGGATPAGTTPIGTIQVIVEGIREEVGTIRLALDNTEETYLGKLSPDFRTGSAPATGTKTIFEFHDIPVANYALKIFHDANDNEKLDTNLLGIPSEPYGISNDARGVFGLPNFEDAIFKHKGPLTILTITLKTHLPRVSH